MTLIRSIIFCIAFVHFLSCARQTAPTGGPKDTIPPTLVMAIPKNGSIEFHGTQIILGFSETVITNSPKEQILITPDINKKFKVETKNKLVTLYLETQLQPNTTYLLNFRDAVQDITEKNPVANLKLAFSTGLYIDSLSIKGNVKDLLKATEIKEATVALYEADTFSIFKHRPIYVTKTNKAGQYTLEYLKPGTYYIYAIEDKNKNLIVDSKTENYGFIATQIKLDSNQSNVNLTTYRLDARPQKLTSVRPYNTYTTISMTKGVKSYRLTTPNNDSVYSMYGEEHSAIQIYNTFPNQDSVQVHFVASDSINQTIDSTFFIKFSPKKATPEKFTVKFTDLKFLETKREITIKGNFTKPITTINYDSIYLMPDTVQKIKIPTGAIKIDNQNKELVISLKVDKPKPQQTAENDNKPMPRESVLLYFGKTAFMSVEADSSAATSQKLTLQRTEDLGTVSYTINTTKKNFIVELLSKDYKTVATKINQKAGTFEDVPPADYYLRVTIDSNADGAWTPGNFQTKTEPEKFVYYLNEKKNPLITLKANWELGPLLITF